MAVPPTDPQIIPTDPNRRRLGKKRNTEKVMNAAAPRYSKMESGIRRLDNLLAFTNRGRHSWICDCAKDSVIHSISSDSGIDVAALRPIVAALTSRFIRSVYPRCERQLTAAHFLPSNDSKLAGTSRSGSCRRRMSPLDPKRPYTNGGCMASVYLNCQIVVRPASPTARYFPSLHTAMLPMSPAIF